MNFIYILFCFSPPDRSMKNPGLDGFPVVISPFL